MTKLTQNDHIYIANTIEVLENVIHKIRSITKLYIGLINAMLNGNMHFQNVFNFFLRQKKTQKDD